MDPKPRRRKKLSPLDKLPRCGACLLRDRFTGKCCLLPNLPYVDPVDVICDAYEERK